MEQVEVSNRIRSLAENLAYSSDYYPYRVGAVIAKKRRIISVGHNRDKTHTIIRNKLDKYSLVDKLHAEMDAILRARTDLSGSIIYVLRACPGDDGGAGMARPCKLCMKLIRCSGIREIVYTTGNSSQPWLRERIYS